MTKSDHERLQIVEQELSEKLAEKLQNLFEGFCREHNCQVNPVVFYAPTPMGNSPAISTVQFHCVSEERIRILQQDREPRIIQSVPGRLVN